MYLNTTSVYVPALLRKSESKKLFGNDVGSWCLDARSTGLRPKRYEVKSKSQLSSRQLSISNLNLSQVLNLCPLRIELLNYKVYLEDIHGILRIKRIMLKLVDKLAYLYS